MSDAPNPSNESPSRDPGRYATTDGNPPASGLATPGSSAPQPIDPRTGQHRAYWILSASERAKGFVRPVRCSYRHVGIRPKYPLRDLTVEEKERFAGSNYTKYEAYPVGSGSMLGRYWTDAQLNSGCEANTSMSRDIAETYAREPSFYGSTFCSACRKHLPVEEFRWLDARGSLTDEAVGS